MDLRLSDCDEIDFGRGMEFPAGLDWNWLSTVLGPRIWGAAADSVEPAASAEPWLFGGVGERPTLTVLAPLMFANAMILNVFLAAKRRRGESPIPMLWKIHLLNI